MLILTCFSAKGCALQPCPVTWKIFGFRGARDTASFYAEPTAYNVLSKVSQFKSLWLDFYWRTRFGLSIADCLIRIQLQKSNRGIERI